MSKKFKFNGFMNKNFKIESNMIFPVIFVLLGIVLIVWWMPIWIWFVFMGIILIIFGIKRL